MEIAETATITQLRSSLNIAQAATARRYINTFWPAMSSAERIGALRNLIETGCATDDEECELLDILDPNSAYNFEE